MTVTLKRATVEDAKEIWEMQLEAFAKLLEKYQDFDTSPGNEPLERVRARLEQAFTYFYFVCLDETKVGAIRVVDNMDQSRKRISPLFILSQYRNKGIAQQAIALCEEIHGSRGWELDTILQEQGNCHLYEKMGYVRTGDTKVINERLTLVFYEKEA